MANRYWVNSSGLWSSSNTANWSATSGGGGGASVPTAFDDVFFDANSNFGTNPFTVTLLNNPRLCRDITISGLDGDMTLSSSGSVGLTVSGSLSFPATRLTRIYTAVTTFNATTTGKTVTTNGVSFGSSTVIFNGSGGGWTLGSSLTCTVGIGVIAGTFSTSATGYAITAAFFSSSVTSTRTIDLNSSTITLTTVNNTWLTSTTTNLTFNAGTSTINLTSSSCTFSGGGLTFYDVAFTTTASGTKNLIGANTFNNLSFGPLSNVSYNPISIRANNTINGTLTITGADGNRRFYVFSDVLKTVRTLTCNAVSLTDVDFEDIEIAGTAAPASGTRLGDRVNNAGITFTTPKTVYWNLAAGGNWDTTSWATSSGGAVANTNFPLPQDTAIIEDAGLDTSATITLNRDYGYPSFDASTRTNAWLLRINQTSSFYGNFAVNTAVNFSGFSRTLFFNNESTKTFDSGGKTFNFHNINLECPSTTGGLQLINSNLTLSGGGLTLTGGTLDLNNLTFSISSAFTAGTGTLSRDITFNGGTLVVGTTFTGGSTNFTTTAGTGSGVISMTRATAKTFTGNGVTYNCSLNQGGAGNLTISGSNTFDDITNSVQPATILFTVGTTQTVNNFSLSGTSGNLITIDSTTAFQFTLSKASGRVSVSFLNVRDSIGTGGATWEAFTSNGNVDGGNNTGWIFNGADAFVSESATGSDEIFSNADFGSQIDESATGSDQVSSNADFASKIDEASTAFDEVSVLGVFNGQIEESATGTDEVSVLGVFNGQIEESATGADEVLAGVIFLVVVLDSSIGLDAVLSASDFTSLIQESTQGQDLVVVVIDFGSSVQETATGAEQSVGFKIVGGSITETVTASEIASVLVDFLSNVSESAIGADEVLAGVDFASIAAETAVGVAQVLATGSFQHFINETASGLDAPSSNAQFNSLVQELGIAVDSPLARFLWELINNSQSVSWQNVQSSGATNWQNVQSSGATNWQNIPTIT